MKTIPSIPTVAVWCRRVSIACICLSLPFALRADLNIPSDGSDGALEITGNTLIDLGDAVNGSWDTNNAANPGRGVYDKDKWAVVFKYSSVNIAAGATVTFTNHPSRAPVVWLVSGDVTIDGTVSVDGRNGVTPPLLAEPGPGGFRGGAGYTAPGLGAGAGLGVGGAGFVHNQGYGGSYGSAGNAGPAPYGNPSLVPLLGGSGGGGDGDQPAGGGGGGGAILIACEGTLLLNGVITANGGSRSSAGNAGGGSGGGVRLVCGQLSGSGVVRALGGAGWDYSSGVGRIRIERASNTSTLQITPDASVVPLLDGATPLLWLPAEGPTARIVSIGGVSSPSDPKASFDAFGPDVAIPQVATTQVVVETVNVEPESQVLVRVTPRSNSQYTELAAGNPEVLSPNPLTLRWTAEIPVNTGNSAVQVRVKRP